MLDTLPLEVWGKILTYLDETQRVEVCIFLIKTGLVHIQTSVFITCMLMLAESMKFGLLYL